VLIGERGADHEGSNTVGDFQISKWSGSQHIKVVRKSAAA